MPVKYLVTFPVEVRRAPSEPYVEGEWETASAEMEPASYDPKHKVVKRRRMIEIPVIADSQNEAERRAQEIITLLVGRAYGSFDGNGSPL